MQTRHYIVSGKVQGVYFRASTQEFALQNNLTGWVRNLPNGNVEAMASGTAEDIEKLNKWIHQGPEAAVVNDVIIENVDFKNFEGFQITG